MMEKQEIAIQITHLHKNFGKKTVVKDVSLETYCGEVFGFLGPNGAGKTTTIKMVVGLLNKDSGEISIMGHSVDKAFEKAMEQVGGIVENPEMYKYMTGMQNLRQYARMRGKVDQKRIDEVVELVGLSNRIHEKVGKYSLGMKQRLGVAQSILHRPRVLILDEPTNGLDPAGIKQLRDILKHLAHEEGVCVLVSSHMMSEMELMCDRVGIIVNGVMLDVKTIEELMRASTRDGASYVYYVNEGSQAKAVLEKFQDLTVTLTDQEHVEVHIPKDLGKETLLQCTTTLLQEGVAVYTVVPVDKKRLEEAFLELTEQEGGTQIV